MNRLTLSTSGMFELSYESLSLCRNCIISNTHTRGELVCDSVASVLTRQVECLPCFKSFMRHTEGDTEANAEHKLKSAIRQVAEGKCLLFILPVDFLLACLPVPSVLSELAILSVSLSPDDFFFCRSVSVYLAVFLQPPLSLSLLPSLYLRVSL